MITLLNLIGPLLQHITTYNLYNYIFINQTVVIPKLKPPFVYFIPSIRIATPFKTINRQILLLNLLHNYKFSSRIIKLTVLLHELHTE